MNFFISAELALCAEVDLVELFGPGLDPVGDLIRDDHPLGTLGLAMDLVAIVGS